MDIRYWVFLLVMMLMVSGCGKGDASSTETPAPREEVVDAEGSDLPEEQEFDEGVFADKDAAAEADIPVADLLTKEEVQAIAKGRFVRAMEKVPPFDRDAATHKLMLEKYEVNMDNFPEKPLAPKELHTLFMSGLKLRADEQFPEADKEHVEKQATEQFPMYKKGDSIKLVLVRGPLAGTIESMSADRIKVDGRHILVRDIRQPTPESFDVPRIEKRRKHYVSLNYGQPRQRYITQMAEEERAAFYQRHFYVKGTSGWFRADQAYAHLKAKDVAKLERLYMDEQRFLLRKKIEQELRDEGLWDK
jgi:hypothetical protein